MKGDRTTPAFLFALTIASLALLARITTEQDKTTAEYLSAQAGVAYVGDEACQECHESQYKDFKKNWHGESSFHPRSRQLAGIYQACDAVQQKLNRTYTVSVIDGKMYHAESKRDTNGKPE